MVLKMIIVMFQYRFVSKFKVKENIIMALGVVKHRKSPKCTLVDVGNCYKSKDREQTFNCKSVTALETTIQTLQTINERQKKKTAHC